MKLSDFEILEDKYIAFYKSFNMRWENNYSDPEVRDIDYFHTLEEAEDYIENEDVFPSIIGFTPVVERILIRIYDNVSVYTESKEYNDICKNMFDELSISLINTFLEDATLADLEDEEFLEISDREIVSAGEEYTGESIEGAVIIEWSWQKYINYCRNFHKVRYGLYKEYENDLTDNSDSVFKKTESVLVSAKDAENLTDEELLDEGSDTSPSASVREAS